MILAGDPNWMRGYTHYEWKTGRQVWVANPPVRCTRCRGAGWYEY
jgi:hypothetical protein